eukprot:m.71943 g.71943  ORF g.71943 m.71943 type:complete len:93 (+) comp35767_c0_seq24:171-449(+)
MSSSSPPWLHHGMSRIEAESLLVESSKTGAFLLRESESRPGSYVLSLLHEDKVHHYRIMGSTDGRFFVQVRKHIQWASGSITAECVGALIRQ